MNRRTRDFFDKVASLTRATQPFAVATVVARRAPVSAHLGDRAIVYADGRMEGFIGGACSREIIRKQALEALRTRHARLVSIRPDAAPDASDPERVTVAMTCASEGAVDVYVEPVMPPRRLLVVGATPVAEALARVGRAIDYDVVRVVDASEQRDIAADAGAEGIAVVPLDSLKRLLEERAAETACVVASQGHYDEQALEAVLTSGAAAYVGLVASRKRGATVRELLEAGGVKGLENVRNPAGLDLGARTPSEVALSILAEIVQEHPSEVVATGEAADAAFAPAPVATVAIDPVCGMEVVMAAARHQADHEGTTYFFCCPHCRAHFLKDPQAYLAARS